MAAVYDSQNLIDNYTGNGTFPKIHDAISAMVKEHAWVNEVCFDIGSSVGLLAVRNVVEGGRSLCVGIEPSRSAMARAVRHPAVTYECLALSGMDNLMRFAGLIGKWRPTLITARRVLPEIDASDNQAIEIIAQTCYISGVEKIIIQGRVPVKNPRSRLHCVDEEIKALERHYEAVVVKGQVAVLKRKR